MKIRLNTMLSLLLLVLVVAMPGCIKYKQALTLMPDGSGKVEITWGMSAQLVAMAKQEGEDPFEKLSPEGMKEQVKGIAAFTKPKRKDKDGYSYISYTAYFEDINAVKLDMNQSKEDGEGGSTSMDFGEAAKYTYKRNGDTATFTIEKGVVLSMIAEAEPTPEDQKGQIKAMMTGFEVSEQFTLPGTFKDIKGVTGVDNTAMLKITLDDMVDGTGVLKDLKGTEKLTFTIDDITVGDEAVAAFKKEMKQAIAASKKKD